MEVGQIASSVLYAVLAAVAFAVIGFYKRTDKTEPFSTEKFFTTIVVGIIAGLASLWLNLSPEAAVQMIFADAGLVYVIEGVTKSIWRRWISPWLDKNKAAAAVTPPPP